MRRILKLQFCEKVDRAVKAEQEHAPSSLNTTQQTCVNSSRIQFRMKLTSSFTCACVCVCAYADPVGGILEEVMMIIALLRAPRSGESLAGCLWFTAHSCISVCSTY